MNVKSPISNLRDVLAQVKDVGVTYRSQFHNNEAATRLALIDPILAALGWNMANPLMVVVEYAIQPVKADYVLYDTGRIPKIVVEAKSFPSNLAAARPQLFATAAGVQANQEKCGFLTDGLKWEHFTDQTALNNHSRIWADDLETGDLQRIAVHLIRHLDAAQFWPEEKDTTAPEILRLQKDYSALEKRVLSLESSGSQLPPSPLPAQDWVDLDKFPDVTNTLPSQMRLPDGNTVSVRSWSQALVAACEYVLNSDPQLPIPFPDSAKGTINLLSAVKRPTGQSRQIQTKSGSTIFVYINFSANGCVANINHIFNHIASKQSVKPAVVYASV